ncbi:MAG: carboxypeptidase-like regulatory domain-containing protein [Bacteroidia bacterium]|nr:carboxypeptidase-like regulatory domain-containing protein [Bacteroidia bacterium]
MKLFTKIFFCFLLMIILSSKVLFSQNNFIISGNITDKETGKPVYNASIIVKNTKNGTTTNHEGFFFMKVNKLPVNLEISHIAYKKITFYCKNNTSLKIELQRQIDSLPEINISAHKVINLVEKKLFDVVDYEFYGDNILLLTYSYKDIINPWLIMINNYGDTLFKSPVSKEGNFYRDCLGNIHLVSKEYAYQIFIEDKKLELLYPVNPDTFYKILNPCITEINNKFFIKQWSYNNQVLSYSMVNANDSSKKEVKVISDERAIRMLSDRNRFNSMGAKPPSDADLRFEEMCFFKPIFAPLVKLKDKIAIFNFVESKIEVYNENGNSDKEISITFNKIKGWKEEIFADEITGKAYALFKNNGISTIREVSIETGVIGKEITIPDFKYIENIKVRNGYVYFLYRINSPMELMKLYKMAV